MEKYEYLTFEHFLQGFVGKPIKTDKIKEQLDILGNEGWEMVSNTPKTTSGTTFSFVYTFKRKKA